MFILGIASGTCLFILVFFIFFYPAYNTKIELDEEILAINKEQKAINDQLVLQYTNTKQQIENLCDYKTQVEETITILSNHYQDLEDKLKLQFEDMAELLREQYLNAADDAKKEYLQSLKECGQGMQASFQEQSKLAQELTEHIQKLKNQYDSALLAQKREEEKKQQTNFYRLSISDADKEEIKKLRSVLPYLRDQEPLNKVIWKVYYENPTSDLIGRVVGDKIRSGIYKITNLENNMCYIGQCVNFADRWRQHIKRGLGADTPTRNKLYPAMQEFGVENFTFEIIEDCPREELDDHEDYWQDYFQAKIYGYSIK